MKRKSFIIAVITLLTALLMCGCSLISESGVTSADKSNSNKALSQTGSEINSTPPKDDTTASELPPAASNAYTMADVKKLKNTEHFAKKTLEHIFDGTINSKGKATGYHYTQITDSKGEVIAGTESKKDRHGVFTAKVKVKGVKKEGFSSFYPEDWTPQQVIDAINEAYDDAMSDKSNPHGSIWIGYSGDLEINMYLDGNKRITTAFPIYEGE